MRLQHTATRCNTQQHTTALHISRHECDEPFLRREKERQTDRERGWERGQEGEREKGPRGKAGRGGGKRERESVHSRKSSPSLSLSLSRTRCLSLSLSLSFLQDPLSLSFLSHFSLISLSLSLSLCLYLSLSLFQKRLCNLPKLQVVGEIQHPSLLQEAQTNLKHPKHQLPHIPWGIPDRGWAIMIDRKRERDEETKKAWGERQR